MRFSPGAQLDASSVSDRRGMGGGRAPLAIGGTGAVGIVLYLLVSLLGGGATGPEAIPLGRSSGAQLSASCQTGSDANQRQDCRVVGVVNSVQDHWSAALPGYRSAPTVLFSGSTPTGCGGATSAVGPFYCPADQTVYIDLGFFDELHSQFGARGGPFAEAYVLAHEYGHHVQHLTGTDRQVGRDRDGPTSGSVRLELQADCYAGVWAANAKQSGFIEELTDDDIAVGLDAAASVGDDRIQQASTGRVDPERFTHGSAAQRQRWFTTGFRSGQSSSCDTFASPSL
jgi:predicted metalloprotease